MAAVINTLQKSIQELWDDYYFLTKEMGKFLELQDMELFAELLEQRETLQKMIEAAQDDDFALSDSGKELLQTIQKANQNVVLKLQYLINNSRNQHNISRAYDGLGTDFVGNRMDRQT